MPINDVIDRHTDTLIDILERLPSSYRTQIAAVESIARGTPSFLTELGSDVNMQAFILSTRNNDAKIEPFLRELFAKLALREEEVPLNWEQSSKLAVGNRVLSAAYAYHRATNSTMRPQELNDSLRGNIEEVLQANPQYYILLLWALAPEIKVGRA